MSSAGQRKPVKSVDELFMNFNSLRINILLQLLCTCFIMFYRNVG